MPGSTASGSQSGVVSLNDSIGTGLGDNAIIRPGQEDDLLEDRAFSHGAMGVMYTVCKEKARYGPLFIAFRLLADWLQLWLLVVQPPQFDLPPDKLWWQIINFISLNQFMAGRGYTFFLACFYLLVVGLLLSVGLSVWVGWSFQQNRFDHVWPIIILRWFAKIFYQMLDIMSMSLFLMALDCQLFYRPDDVLGYNQEFPEVYCWSMPHLIHVFVAVISLILFLVLAGAFTVGEMELDFTTHNSLAIMHTGVELWTFIIRVLMTFVSVLVYNPKWASVAQLFLSCWLVGLVWYWQLQLEGWVNHLRVGMYTSVAWCSVLYVISAFNLGWDGSDADASQAAIHNLTIAMWATTIPVGALGAYFSWRRLHYFRTDVLDKFRHEVPRESEDNYEFPDSRFAEVLARCCRVWIDRVSLQPDGVLLAEKVLRAGLMQMPKDPFMVILYSSFLMDVQCSYQSGYTQLQAAKKLELSFLMRFAIFSREQQHAQRSTGGKHGDQAADLVSYVEYQRNYSLALKVHREALINMTRFWECLLHKNVKFRTLSDTIKAMDISVRQAERVYKTVLQRHASSVKIVRLYAKFLEQIKQDPWAAARWFNEAERLEATEEDMKQQDTLGGAEVDDPALRAAMGTGPMSSSYGHDNRGVIVMNAQSIVQMTNPAVHSMLGFSKTELQGKSLRAILPPRIADTHVTSVRNYVATGRARVMNRTIHQVAMHKDRRMLPIWLTVTNIKGIGEDSIFMGVMEPVQLPKDTATIWLMMDGTILTASDTFADWTGFNVGKEVLGQGLNGFVVKGMKQLDVALKRARASQAAENQRQMALYATESDGGFLSVSRKKSHGSIVMPSMSAIKAVHGQQSMAMSSALSPAPLTQLTELGTESDAAFGPSKNSASDLLQEASLLGLEDPAAVPVSPSGKPTARVVSRENSVLVLKNSQDYVLEPSSPKPPGLYGGIDQSEDSWEAGLVQLAHKYGSPVNCEISITNGGVGSMQFHVISIKKLQEVSQAPDEPKPHTSFKRSGTGQLAILPNAVPQELMVVSDSKGQVVHITERLLELLGRKHLAAAKCGALAGLDQIMVKPFAQLHKILMQGIQPVTIPTFSCRSGLSVLFQGQGRQGQALLHPYKLNISRKIVNDEAMHVTLLQQRTLDQALDERRLLLEVDEFGTVSVLSRNTPASLLGCEPERLQGRHVSSFLDVLRPPGTPSHTGLDTIEQEYALTVLLDMLTPALHSGSASWRAGFISPEAAPANSESQTSAKVRGFLSGQLRPVVMKLRVQMAGPESTVEEGGITIEMELWRADMCSSVIEVDKNGMIQPPEHLEVNAMYPADLVLGGSEGGMLDQHIATYLPVLAQKQMSELMNEGVFGTVYQPSGLRGKRSAMKNKPVGVVGPAHVVSILHHQDKAQLQVSLQAVRKSGHQTGYYLLIHPIKPTTGRQDVATWLASQRTEAPALVHDAPVAASDGISRKASLRMPLSHMLHSSPMPPLDPPPVTLYTTSAQHLSRSQSRARTSAGARFADPPMPAEPRALAVLDEDHPAGDHGLEVPARASPKHPTVFGAARPYSSRRPHSSHTQTEEERERVSAWLHSTKGQHSGEQDVVSLSGSESGSQIQAGKDDQDDAASSHSSHDEEESKTADVPTEAEEHQVDEGDYKRGQRFKRLFALLSNSQVQKPIETYRKRTYLLSLAVCCIQLGAFITMYTLLQNQTSMVLDLSSIGKGGVAATDVAVYTRAINIIYANMTVPTLRLVSGPDDLPYLKSLYIKAAKDFKDLHRGAFLGFNKPRRLPEAYGLRSLWEESGLTIVETSAIEYNQSLGNFTVMRLDRRNTTASLWEAGNLLAEKAANLWLNSDTYNQSDGGNLDGFSNDPNLMWIIDNAPGAVFPGYLQTLDSYLELVIASADEVNVVQIILLIIEGLVACSIVSVWSWILLGQVAKQRFKAYHIFMLVPLTLVRRLATKQYILGDEEEEDKRDERPEAVAKGLTAEQSMKEKGEEKKDIEPGESKAPAVPTAPTAKLHVKAIIPIASSDEPIRHTPEGWLKAVKSIFSFKKASADVPESKRQLLPCRRTTAWLMWPFLLWGIMNIISNSLGFMLLKATSGPVAMFNMVNYVNLLYARNNFYLQELTFEPDPSKMDGHRQDSFHLVQQLEKEYKVMLYGGEMVPNETSPHYRLVTQGLAYGSGDGPTILFNTQDCLCTNTTECQTPDSHLYTDTHGGLDRMMIKYIEVGYTIPLFQYLDPYLNGPQYDFYWNTVPDITGGFSRLTSAYQKFVTSNIASVTTLHVAIFVLTLLLVGGFLLFMVRPFLKVTSYETRRIAELLSQLPPEVDVANLVQATLLTQTDDMVSGAVQKNAGKNDDITTGPVLKGSSKALDGSDAIAIKIRNGA